jgi:hypothetical protein
VRPQHHRRQARPQALRSFSRTAAVSPAALQPKFRCSSPQGQRWGRPVGRHPLSVRLRMTTRPSISRWCLPTATSARGAGRCGDSCTPNSYRYAGAHARGGGGYPTAVLALMVIMRAVSMCTLQRAHMLLYCLSRCPLYTRYRQQFSAQAARAPAATIGATGVAIRPPAMHVWQRGSAKASTRLPARPPCWPRCQRSLAIPHAPPRSRLPCTLDS